MGEVRVGSKGNGWGTERGWSGWAERAAETAGRELSGARGRERRRVPEQRCEGGSWLVAECRVCGQRCRWEDRGGGRHGGTVCGLVGHLMPRGLWISTVRRRAAPRKRVAPLGEWLVWKAVRRVWRRGKLRRHRNNVSCVRRSRWP